MRILMLAHKLPYPPRTGDKVRAYHVARHLARDHELTLACLVEQPDSDGSLTALRQEIPDIEYAIIARERKRLGALVRLARGGSATMAYFDSPALHLRVGARLRQDRFDLIYASSSSMAQYVTRPGRTPFVMDFLDVDSDKWLQYGARHSFPGSWIYRLEGKRLRQHELEIARQADRCIVTTRQEQALLHSFAPWAPTSVVPNGVDLDYFVPAAAPTTAPSIVFTGAMDYFPNVDAVVHFARTILPQARKQVPDATFSIVGKAPAPEVRRLGTLPGVNVTGTVPDVRPYLENAALAVAPLRVARGVQNKVLEAMAMGLPVIATSKGHEGLEARPGKDLLVEDDPAKFADLVVAFLRDPSRRAQIGRAARHFVEAHHSWAASMAKLDRLLSEVTRHPRPHAAEPVS